jgi:hypothetical protein
VYSLGKWEMEKDIFGYFLYLVLYRSIMSRSSSRCGQWEPSSEKEGQKQ